MSLRPDYAADDADDPAQSALTVTVLGCSGTYAAAGGACSGYLVRSPGATMWVDCGPGTLANVQHHVDLRQIDALVLSHSHPDHWLELPVLANALEHVHGESGLAVYGTEETRAQAEVLAGGDLGPTVDWTPIADGSRFEVGDLAVACSRTDHPVETLALRIDRGGASIGYTADTGPDWTLAGLVATGPIDLLLCEATLAPEDAGSVQHHLTAAQAGSLAAGADVRRLVLTHLLPGADPELRRQQAEATLGRDVELASVGATFEVEHRRR